MSSDWKQPITLEELYDIHRVSATRGKLKAKQRHTTLVKRAIQYKQRAVDNYQVKLGLYYLRNFEVEE